MFSLIALWTIGGKYRRAREIIYHNDLHPPRFYSGFGYLSPKYSPVALMQHRYFRFLQNSNDPFIRGLRMVHFSTLKKVGCVGVKDSTGNNPGLLQ